MNKIYPATAPLFLLTTVLFGCSGGSGKGGPGGGASGGTSDSTNGGSGAGNSGNAGAGGQGGTEVASGGTVGTGGSVSLDPSIVTRLTFDGPADLGANFFVPEGADAVHVKDGALAIDYGKPRTLIFDRDPDATPTDLLDAPLTISFRFKANTTAPVPPVSVTTRGALGSPHVWVSFFGGADRKNAGQVHLSWSEVDEDRLSFHTGIDLGAIATKGTEVGSNVEWNPLFNGDVYYTMKVVLRRLQGTQLYAGLSVSQDGHLLLRRSYTFANLPVGAGEIAIGGDTGRGTAGELWIDDLEIRKGGEAFEEPVYTAATVSGQPARMYLPSPSMAPVKGILFLAPGSGGSTVGGVEGEANRLFARLHGFALIGYKNGLPVGSFDTLFQQFGQMTNHPELSTVPLVMYGFSAGSIDITSYANSHATRVIGLVPDAYASPSALTGAAQKIPSLFLLGQNESDAAQKQASMQQVRTVGGAVGFLEKQGLPHTPKGSDTIFLPYLDRAIATRFANYVTPVDATVLANGWLLDNSSYSGLAAGIPNPVAKIAAVADFIGNANAATWLPSADAAMATAAYVTYEKALALSPMPHGKAGESRTVTLRVRDDMKDFTEIKLYDFAKPLTTLAAGAPLTFAWNNIPSGLHALSARMSRGGKEFSSFVITVIMLP